MSPENITYQQKLNQLRLDISHPNNEGVNFVMVEGKNDVKFFRTLFDEEKCKVEYVPGGKGKMELCVDEFIEKYKLIIGIRDADFHHLSEMSWQKANIFLTDYHDVEMMILAEKDVLFSVLSNYADISSRSDCIVLRDKLLNIIEKISYLKWLNDREVLKFKFEGIGFQHLISLTDFQLNFNQYFSNLLSKSTNAVIKDLTVILQKINELIPKNPDLLQLTNGHDAAHVFSKYLTSKQTKGISNEGLEKILKSAFSYTYFQRTNLYQALSEWADENNTQLFTA